ncbi:metal-binding protein [Clostridium sp. 19966]|uniref:metal-binding protein n=1 Tax=Clostridium sp. 19966 TaxID=2768166 RepID=UPI0028DD7BA8|nr:metal-binding protein [Clostridium sp. 19966]MDT8717252.1 metal-binding protein [Clostridium sp. 19966]
MTLNDIMKYVESEYSIINETHCEVCGGEFITEALEISLIDGEPFDICDCICENCGHEKEFIFSAPFINNSINKHNLN